MTLFDKKLAKSAPDKWEKKYFTLLNAHDALEQSAQANETLLCKTVTRLALAATGFNRELDPYLTRIRKQLKNGLKSEKLKMELEEFSNALMTFDDKPETSAESSPVQLVEFLNRQFPHRKNDFADLCRQYRNTPKASIQDLLLALHELIDEEQSVVTEIQSATESDSIIRKQLMRLIESTEIPPQFSAQGNEIKQLIQDDHTPVVQTLEATFSLLLQIKKHFQSEQQAMAEFLARISEQLNQLGQQASGVEQATEKNYEKRNLLDQTVTRQMLDLQNSSASATELEPLKQLVNASISSITEQLQKHQQQDRAERDQHKKSLQQLTDKINQLEAESGDLKNQLAIAHHRALKDPLTGLPNRIAYDERLDTELARRHRYCSALTLIIWDIDFFKKINDTYGHKAGDRTLKIIAHLLEQNCRETDFISRFGGEEFVMLLPDTTAQSALVIADKLRSLIAKTGFNANNDRISITVSAGIYEFTDADDTESAFKKADTALYEAKHKGRNQCIIAT